MKQLALSLDYEFELAVHRKNPATGIKERAEGLTDWYVHIASTKGGTAINPSLSQHLVERSQALGTYYAVFETADLIAYLSALNQIWFVVTKLDDVTSYSFPYTVVPLAYG